MKVHSLLSEDLVLSGLAGRTRDDVLREMTGRLGGRTGPVACDVLLAKLLEREDLGTTAIGGGVAIPHCKVEGLETPVLMLGLSREGISFRSVDGRTRTSSSSSSPRSKDPRPTSGSWPPSPSSPGARGPSPPASSRRRRRPRRSGPCARSRTATMPERRAARAEKVEQTTISAGLLKICGVGTLIVGDSGIGKSESALELIARGHKFIADDVVCIRKAPGGSLRGSAPPVSRNFMEIRGLGIINIREIFGSASVAAAARVDLIIRLKHWRRGFEVDRLGLKVSDEESILGVKVPQLAIPVAPGRNIATLIEVACKVHLLRERGYHAPSEIIKRLDRILT